MTKSLRIGALAQATGRSVHAIRWYERQGLIPRVGRDRGGRRVYEPSHIDWLMFLERLRFTGMTVRDMRRYVDLVVAGHSSLGARQALLARHRDEVKARAAATAAALFLIEEKIAYYREWEANRRRPGWTPGSLSKATIDLEVE